MSTNTKNKITIKLSFLLLVIISVFVSCNDANKKEVQTTEALSNNTTETTYSHRFENPQWAQKYNKYIAYLNGINAELNAPLQYYFDGIPEDGPKKGMKDANLITISDYPTEALLAAQAIAVEVPELDTIANIVNKEYKKLQSAVNGAEVYYKKKDFEKDDYAQGKKYHQSISSSSESLFKNMDLLGLQIQNLEKQLADYELELNKKEGLMMRYYMLKVLAQTKKATEFANVEDMQTFVKTDATAVKVLITELTKSISEANELAKDEERYAKEFSNISAKIHYNAVLKEANRMVENMNALTKRLQNQNFERSKRKLYISGKTADGLPDAIIANHDGMITAYNKLIK